MQLWEKEGTGGRGEKESLRDKAGGRDRKLCFVIFFCRKAAGHLSQHTEKQVKKKKKAASYSKFTFVLLPPVANGCWRRGRSRHCNCNPFFFTQRSSQLIQQLSSWSRQISRLRHHALLPPPQPPTPTLPALRWDVTGSSVIVLTLAVDFWVHLNHESTPQALCFLPPPALAPPPACIIH